MAAAPSPAPETQDRPRLVRGLGVFDAALITVGSIVGSAIFIAAADVARALPHPSLILLAWTGGGLLTLAGALTYAELGGMFPRAGGQYHYLKEAYGPLWGFLFGWACFLVIMSGGLAALAVGFGEYLGSFFPFFAGSHVLLAVPVGAWTWQMTGAQLGGALALVVLTAINYVGLKEGTGVQNVVTLAKIGSILALATFGTLLRARVHPAWTAPLPPGSLLAAVGLGMIAVVWSYDGWYGATYMAGEMRDPERTLPRGLVIGTVLTTALYVVMNLVYVRVLSIDEMRETARIGETAATTLLGAFGGRLVAAAVVVSIFGCLSSTILYCGRVYLPMAQDGLFFRSVARIHPRFHTPSNSILAQGAWAIVLTFSGTYEQLYTYVVFAMFCFHAATGAAVFVLRRTRPDARRPYRAWGYPWVPGIFILTSLAFVLNTLFEKPKESVIGLVLVGLGLPAYFFWKRTAHDAGGAPADQ
jgi:APA family basic amino acid/polyamine antiporter